MRFVQPEVIARRTNSRGLQLDPTVLLRHAKRAPKLDVLRRLAGRSICEHTDVSREETIELCRLAALMEANDVAGHHPLDGKLVITAFFEASTRTRLSFESAVLRLDGKILSVPDGSVTGTAKGESLADVGEMFNSYADLVVVRHPETDALRELATGLDLPIINAGNGSGEHPTQALVDWFALLKWRPELADRNVAADRKIHLGIIGTPGNMRAVKSFLLRAVDFAPAIRKLTVVSEMADPFGNVLDDADRLGFEVEITNESAPVLPTLDVVYMNSIALLGDSYHLLGEQYQLHPGGGLRPDAVVMHPLARREELSTKLDETPQNLYFAQAAGATYLRQALLTAVLDRLERLPFLTAE
ncbi:MAG: aspartate carbamoyltransferase [Myxococcales bacterium FL481]|nr:MAG: aspartate carbamoyltransferase [Myxococcales bacterium FL481]